MVSYGRQIFLNGECGRKLASLIDEFSMEEKYSTCLIEPE